MRSAKPTPYSKILIRTERLLLRPYKLTDYAVCTQSHTGRLPKKNRFDQPIPIPASLNYDAFKKRVDRYRARGKSREHYVLGIFDIGSGAYVGQVDIKVLNSELRWGNLGYVIQNQFWNRGYVTEACQELITFAFKKLDFHRIEASAEPENKASIRVAQKIGLTYEGKRRKFFPQDGGIDLIVFGTNAIDW